MSDLDRRYIEWIQSIASDMAELTNPYWFYVLTISLFLAALFSMSPLNTKADSKFSEHILVKERKLIILTWFLLFCYPLLNMWLYAASNNDYSIEGITPFLTFYLELTKQQWPLPIMGLISGLLINFMYQRYMVSLISKFKRALRFKQSNDELSDIRNEKKRFKAKDFLPSKHYDKNGIVVGLDENNKPLYIDNDTWYETNMQVVGPTRYGKGVILGGLIDQAIRRNDTVFYIDPKEDKFLPYIMYNACKEMGRKFVYVSLKDGEIGSYSPFTGGNEFDARDRIITAFDLALTGHPGTDFYKTQEQEEIDKYFSETKTIKGLASKINPDAASKLKAQLESWKRHESLCPKSGKGFSVEQALLDNAVVYIRGSLTSDILKKATKTLIIEVIQESMRLQKERQAHLSFFIDEVRFLASKQLADAMATAIGFRVNMVLAYQSILDTMTPDDQTLNGKSLTQSINVNSQVKAIYGGADTETAEWGASLSGERLKTITRLEKTEIKSGGGESWEPSRMLGSQAEHLIPANVFLSMPPRVCALYRPMHQAQICFTSFVPVKETDSLDTYIASKQPKKQYDQVKDKSPRDLKDTNAPTENNQKEKEKDSETKMNNLASVLPAPQKAEKGKRKQRRSKQKEKKQADRNIIGHEDLETGFEIDEQQITDFMSESYVDELDN
ncbi:type IV secretory system conjugative DNA transfer family protein (plasmid) [Bermanella marisrubri]|uniref:TriK protein n=1 Tax=Bermanella marisrubri TaxID=207949 RepID=Q1MXI9_9GAMM|nr:type IV secretion system DNA-binding domain-containing protein [Bermanella marisrubri]EAT10683.1 TriK protein [Oceanobacter sp. RED65] [Bermanella marisrubri]QIZ85900.1 type IV secretory system conjugative DNA transfer family protein [Bermanella marisrubri]